MIFLKFYSFKLRMFEDSILACYFSLVFI